MSPTSIVAYLVLFAGTGFAFVLASLCLGWLLRPRAPGPEKLATYECGEQTVGSSYLQFDLRFYVVALVFIVFDVEVAFFFPWAVVFGKATHLMAERAPVVAQAAEPGQRLDAGLSPSVASQLQQFGVSRPQEPVSAAGAIRVAQTARSLARFAMADMAVFFVVLLVGFAYVWNRGDLNWVRAIPQRAAAQASQLGSLAAASVEEA